MWCNELLKRPSSLVPHTRTEWRAWHLYVDIGLVSARNVVQVHVADRGEGVVSKHGVEGFRDLCATFLVDAARIDPEPLKAVTLREDAAIPNLWGYEIAGVASENDALGFESLDLL